MTVEQLAHALLSLPEAPDTDLSAVYVGEHGSEAQAMTWEYDGGAQRLYLRTEEDSNG
jgi:hypothetical protein